MTAHRNTQLSTRRLRKEQVITALVTTVGFTGIAAVILIFVFIAKEALPLLFDNEARTEASFAKMFLPQVLRSGKPPGYMWQPVSNVPKVSMIPLIIGTFKVAIVAMIVSIPIGVSGAIYGSEFAPRRLREFLKPAIEMLSAVPSVVLGIFALNVLATPLQELFGLSSRQNALVAGAALALAIVPVIYTVSEDALQAVPKTYREASLALGATPWETAWRVVLPAAAPGVLAACVLGFGRAIGETMIVLMASGNAAIVSADFGDSVRTLSATIAAEMGEVVVGSPHYAVLFFIGVELFLFTFVLNLAADIFGKRLIRRMRGSESV